MHGQQWGENNPVWHYDDFSTFGERGYLTVSVTGDTVVADRDAKVFEKFGELYYPVGNQIRKVDYPVDIMYEEDRVVYLWNAKVEVFDTLINFAAAPGDSWSIREGGSQSQKIVRTVLDTIPFQVLDQTRRALVVRDSSDRFEMTLIDTLVLGIGPTQGYYRPWGVFDQMLDGDTEGDEFRCYQDDQIGLFTRVDGTCTPLRSPLAFASDSSRWTYDYINFGASGIAEVATGPVIETEGFELFRDLTIRYMLRDADSNKTTDWESLITLQYNYGQSDYVIAQWDSTSTDTIYNFNAVVGDVWHIDLPRAKDAVQCEVLDTGTIFISNYPAKTWTVKYTADYIGDEISYTDTVVEGIGNLRQFILPWDYFESLVDGHRGGTLRCFANEEMSWQRPDIEKCGLELLLSQKLFESKQISIYPNPAYESIYLPKSISGDLTYRLYTIAGHVIEGQVVDKQIEVSSLASGIYFIAILDKGKIIGSARFVKS